MERNATRRAGARGHPWAVGLAIVLLCGGCGDDEIQELPEVAPSAIPRAELTHTPAPITAATTARFEFTCTLAGCDTCGIDLQGALYCWGANDRSQVGGGYEGDVSSPVQSGTDQDWTAIALGRWHTCALKADGGLWCWGGNDDGQLGTGTTLGEMAPVRVGTATWRELAAGGRVTCGVDTAGDYYCWGQGYGDTPRLLDAGGTWTGLVLGYEHGCAFRTGTTPYCWGANTYGQLGDGGRLTATPTVVAIDPEAP